MVLFPHQRQILRGLITTELKRPTRPWNCHKPALALNIVEGSSSLSPVRNSRTLSSSVTGFAFRFAIWTIYPVSAHDCVAWNWFRFPFFATVLHGLWELFRFSNFSRAIASHKLASCLQAGRMSWRKDGTGCENMCCCLSNARLACHSSHDHMTTVF
jgi:hypothetical protein